MHTVHVRKQDQQKQQRLACPSRATALLLALAAVARSASGVPLSDWHDGLATNYGGAQDGMNPYDPSFGTKEVSNKGIPVIEHAALSVAPC